MAITDKEEGVWILDQVYNKQNEGDIWAYTGAQQLMMVGDEYPCIPGSAVSCPKYPNLFLPHDFKAVTLDEYSHIEPWFILL